MNGEDWDDANDASGTNEATNDKIISDIYIIKIQRLLN